ncbi:hypothetical protein NDU88_005403 [Pleurodeles waltl]|uniref:Uncharacterized protein n=1 Tax=Pleurodeles waltl TaxID=8319 RepID=A0AAV7PI00_PLEWA|nr:hypothetical protein NDU88_005403 [Pleurodeles waltl]
MAAAGVRPHWRPPGGQILAGGCQGRNEDQNVVADTLSRLVCFGDSNQGGDCESGDQDDEVVCEVDYGTVTEEKWQEGCESDKTMALFGICENVLLTGRRRQGLIPPYPWGTSAAGFPDPDADRSGTYPQRHPGDNGICKSLLNVTQERTEERGAAEETGEIAVKQGMAATSVVAAAQRETEAAQEKNSGSKEGSNSTRQGTTATSGGAAREGAPGEGGRTGRVQPCSADAETRKWCPKTVVSSPLQPMKGQEAENPGIWPRSGESVASAGTKIPV